MKRFLAVLVVLVLAVAAFAGDQCSGGAAYSLTKDGASLLASAIDQNTLEIGPPSGPFLTFIWSSGRERYERALPGGEIESWEPHLTAPKTFDHRIGPLVGPPSLSETWNANEAG